MMYNNKIAACVKSNGKVLREFGDTVYLPFGSEYSILIKNLNNVRALATVSIDGVDVSDGSQLVINANDSFELTRFIKNGNLHRGNSFKFIERTAAVENHRGIRPDDGLIRIEFRFEQLPRYLAPANNPLTGGGGWLGGYAQSNDPNAVHCKYGSSAAPMGSSISATTFSSNSLSTTAPTTVTNDAGITVAGSINDQQFKTASWFPTETQSYVLVIRLVGATDQGQQILAPVRVSSKAKCGTCGKMNKSSSRYCSECGTAVTVI